MNLFMDTLSKGGFIITLLALMSVVGWSLIIYKGYEIILKFKDLSSHEKNILQLIDNLNFKKFNISEDNKLDYALSYYMNPKYKGLNTIKIIATISPLLGLLGTAVGILLSFNTIAINGLEDPSLFAEGISLALVTTVAGLVVAIPHYIAYNYFSSLLHKKEQDLEQSLLLGNKSS